jgi:hypothetical protein
MLLAVLWKVTAVPDPERQFGVLELFHLDEILDLKVNVPDLTVHSGRFY